MQNIQIMNDEQTHISEYASYVKTIIILLLLTALNIIFAGIDPVSFTPAILLAISCLQAYIALSWLMHLRFDNKLFRFLVMGVFFLFFVVIVILFLDYKLR
jgi:cytochrome c oxidase subunit IV